jgi:hypothetical protein
MDVYVVVDSQNAKRRLCRDNQINVQDFLEKGDDDDDEDDDQVDWNITDIDWTVSIGKPRALDRESALSTFHDLILSSLHRNSQPNDPTDRGNRRGMVKRARELSWILLCRADFASFRYSGLEYSFENKATRNVMGEGEKCLMFRTVDGKEFSFIGSEGYNGSN